MSDALNSDDLTKIEEWCAERLAQYKQPLPSMLSEIVCEYDDALPTHSIRSTIVTLVRMVRDVHG